MVNSGRRSVHLAALVTVATLVIVTIVGSGVVTPAVPPVEDERTTAACPVNALHPHGSADLGGGDQSFRGLFARR